jgi:anti-sigma regulatory factor (Ser/Thr protein kinase)
MSRRREIHSLSKKHRRFLAQQVENVLAIALDAHRRKSKVFHSLKNLGEVIGTEYGERVLFELIQNAHDAHEPDKPGAISIKLVLDSPNEGTLFVANQGRGFRQKDVEAIINIATSGKEVGEGIGNKGLGFRSIEAITDDVRIYSKSNETDKNKFDGFCFRFASEGEIESILLSENVPHDEAREIAKVVPPYLVPLCLDEIPQRVREFAERGYSSVIAAPLRDADAINLVKQQVEEIANLDVPLLLFLERVSSINLSLQTPDEEPLRRRLTRSATQLVSKSTEHDRSISKVTVGKDRTFLVVSESVSKTEVLEAVDESVGRAPALKKWKNWKGDPRVSAAVELSNNEEFKGRLYNFLPMGEAADSPILGHLDAPFFADIDRTDVDFSIPLNLFFLRSLSRTCLEGAEAISKEFTQEFARAAFDLFVWTGEHAEMIDDIAWTEEGGLETKKLIPIISARPSGEWSSLDDVTIWPNHSFSLLKAGEVVKHLAIPVIHESINSTRIDRLRQMASRFYYGDWQISRLPAPDEIAEWLPRYAKTLVDRKSKPATWHRFYKDVVDLCGYCGVPISKLDGCTIFLDRANRLRSTTLGDEAENAIFLLEQEQKGKRVQGGIPLPPTSLRRSYNFFNDKINLHQDVRNAFLEAELLKEFDPVEALRSLPEVIGDRSGNKKRLEALDWAFRVWSAEGAKVEKIIAEIDLKVPTESGWLSANDAVFSAGWEGNGSKVEAFLVEASKFSDDCAHIRSRLLLPLSRWELEGEPRPRKWRQFLADLGVWDGLPPLRPDVRRSGFASYHWENLFKHGDSTPGLDASWCAAVANTYFHNPNTDFQLKGELWRLPGQVEHDEFPNNLKEAFSDLVIKHLEVHFDKFFTARLGRYDRGPTQWNEVEFVTPMGAFLRTAKWLSAELRGEHSFMKCSDCWVSALQRRGVPRFIPRIPSEMRSLLQSEEGSTVLYNRLTISNWDDEATAAIRLQALVNAVGDLEAADRLPLRREWRTAWVDLASGEAGLKPSMPLIVDIHGRLELLQPDEENSPMVIVVNDAQHFEARAISISGHAVLDVGEADLGLVGSLLDEAGGFISKSLEDGTVSLLVDGEVFRPNANDPTFLSVGFEWMTLVACLANEFLGENLERGVRAETIERKLNAIRFRHCSKIELALGNQNIAPEDRICWYAIDDELYPTLLVTSEVKIDWRTLAIGLAPELSRLIDTRIRSLERMFLKLATMRSPNEAVELPSDDELAEALGCRLPVLEDARSSLLATDAKLNHILYPIVGYYLGADEADRFRLFEQKDTTRTELRAWLSNSLPLRSSEIDTLIEVVERSPDRRSAVRELKLEYARFNRVLLALDEPLLTSEDDIRSSFEAFKGEFRPLILDRLRQFYLNQYRAGRDLEEYVDRKSLGFVSLNPEWLIELEVLSKEVVEAHIATELERVLGAPKDKDLVDYKKAIKANRRTFTAFMAEAPPIVEAWCEHSGAELPTFWQEPESNDSLRLLEDEGLLDFDIVEKAAVPALIRRLGHWPEEMPTTLDFDELDLTVQDIDALRQRVEAEREQRAKEKRMVAVAGQSIDSGARNFSAQFQLIAEESIENDNGWLNRSRQHVRLSELSPQVQAGRSENGGPGAERPKRPRKPPESIRNAMGIASEWLAFRYLQERYPEFVDEHSWVSENRREFFGGDKGDDGAGYDFLVRTPNADLMYEVKSSLEDSSEFEFTANEMRVASTASRRGRSRYKILYVPFVFNPEKWRVLELPNPMDRKYQSRFREVGRGAVRMCFERSAQAD